MPNKFIQTIFPISVSLPSFGLFLSFKLGFKLGFKLVMLCFFFGFNNSFLFGLTKKLETGYCVGISVSVSISSISSISISISIIISISMSMSITCSIISNIIISLF